MILVSDNKFYEIEKKRANMGCNRCPCCNENQPYHLLDPNNPFAGSKGILAGIYSSWADTNGHGFWNRITMSKFTYYRIDHYSCETCGATWSSNPYIYHKD